MKQLRTRQEIAYYINIEDYPTLYIDMTENGRPEDFRGYPDNNQYRVGSKIKVQYPTMYNGRYQKTRGNIYSKNGQLYINQGCECIHAGFSQKDLMEMIEWNNVRTVKQGQRVVVVQSYGQDKFTISIKVVGAVDTMCSTVCKLEDVEE